MDDDDRSKPYTLVRAANNDLYLVAKNQEPKKIGDFGTEAQQLLIQTRVDELQTAQNNLEGALRVPVGSGVRIRLPDILD